MKKNGDVSTEKAATITTTEVDTEFDMIDELERTINELEVSLEEAGIESWEGTLSYMRFLINKLADNLSDDYTRLRRQRFKAK